MKNYVSCADCGKFYSLWDWTAGRRRCKCATSTYGMLVRFSIAILLLAFAASSADAQEKPLSYDAAYAKSLREGRPLVMFIGCEEKPVPGSVTCRVEPYEDYKAGQVVVGVPRGGYLYWQATHANHERMVQAQASPFGRWVVNADVSETCQQLLELHDAKRTAPLTMTEELNRQAQAHAELMASKDRMFHSTGNSYGENVAGGYYNAEDVMGGWMRSRGHRENLLDSKWQWCGFGVAMGKSGRLYHCAVFE